MKAANHQSPIINLSNPITMDDERIQQEKAFHDARFNYEVDPRDSVAKYYAIAQSSWDYYRELILSDCENTRVLEYGCGTGSDSFRLAERGAVVTGVDISNSAMERARQIAENKGLKLTFYVMNAEQLDFPDNSFDIICGSAILHHLNIEKAYSELTRVLTPNGKAVFIEPLGHNPAINLYRRLTPHIRTENEHPLLIKDLAMAKNSFGRVDLKFFYLTALLAVPFRKYRAFKSMLTFWESFDQFLFSLFPFIRRYAWTVVITLSQPKKKCPLRRKSHTITRMAYEVRSKVLQFFI